jgi:hypothetical protein
VGAEQDTANCTSGDAETSEARVMYGCVRDIGGARPLMGFLDSCARAALSIGKRSTAPQEKAEVE